MINERNFINGYLTCAIWSSNDNRIDPEGYGTPLDDSYNVDDIERGTRERMQDDCHDFITANEHDLMLVMDRLYGYGEGSAGHDFWLTRNGHGAGFWDRYHGEDADLVIAFERLSEAAQAYGDYLLDSTDAGTVVGLS